MFNKILIANRGEIACRIMRTAHKLGIQCVAVYSEADADALHVKLADEAYCIGPAPAVESYLCGAKIIDVALKSGAQAIHPGYGFLSEKAEFAAACEKAGICFIGPPAKAIAAMGSKSAAKKIMAKAKVPLVPGYHGDDQDEKTLSKEAEKIGYPVLLKATAGGGGKGMRVVNRASEFAENLAGAKREALASFGDDTILIEKYLTQPRHVEIQVFADQHNEFVYLFERDCSIQRRHQKVIEEAPAPGMTASLRKQMGEAAVAAARAIGYIGAGTVEFLLNEDGQFYFMEMNTRLQVEHPVTEMITGQDLVEWQLKVANGESLPLKQTQLKIHGHAFEMRICAEDPLNDFLPSIGLLRFVKTPAENSHVRLDTGVMQGDYISHYYDPMLAKLIVWGEDRDKALLGVREALAQYQIIGVTTNLDLLAAIAEHPDFIAARFDTGFIAKHHAEILQVPEVTAPVLALASLYVLQDQQIYVTSPWDVKDNWRMNLPAEQKLLFSAYGVEKNVVAQQIDAGYSIIIADQKMHVQGSKLKITGELIAMVDDQELKATISMEADKLYMLAYGKRYQITYLNADNIDHGVQGAESKVHLAAPMPSKVVALLVKEGENVVRGAGLAVVEAMKMEHTIHAPADGVIKEWYFKVGDLVQEGVELLAFEENKNA